MTSPRRSCLRPPVQLTLGVLGALALSGCNEVRYLAQAAGGQAQLLIRARPIPRVLADPATSPELRRQLRLVVNVRAFALRDLGLPDNGTFTTYAEVGRPYLVWNVFAAPPLSVNLRTWCFPIAGCVAYRGYFDQASAEGEAARLRAQGDDVFVGGVSAYSTLGKLRDPVPSTLLAYPDASLVRTVIHELAHQVVYVQDDSVFNESFAVTVENEGSHRYLAAFGTPAQMGADRVARSRARQFNILLLGAQSRLAALYAGNATDEQKRAGKEQVLRDLRDQYRELRAEWGGYGGYDFWFASGPNSVNNAALGSVAAYETLVPVFTKLLRAKQGDFPAFYAAVKRCASEPTVRRAVCLRQAAGVPDGG